MTRRGAFRTARLKDGGLETAAPRKSDRATMAEATIVANYFRD
jgi:hypothetical protein